MEQTLILAGHGEEFHPVVNNQLFALKQLVIETGGELFQCGETFKEV